MGLNTNDLRTTVVVRNSTKIRMTLNSAPGQSDEKFICQLMDLWENKGQTIDDTKRGYEKFD